MMLNMKTHKEIEYVNDGFIGQRMVYLPGRVKKKLLEDPRVGDLYLTHIGIFPRALGHLRRRPLGCSQYILIYCLEGEGWIELEGRRHILKANQLFVIPPGISCSYGASIKNPWTNYWLHFTGKNAEFYSPSVGQVVDIPPADDARIDERIRQFEEMLQNAENYFIHERVVYANICLKHFLFSIKYLDIYRSARIEDENDLLKRMISFMKRNLHRNIMVSELAGICGCSTSNIYKLFKQNLGSSPRDFFIALKMERARKYLTQTNMKVKEIGAKLGYFDPYYFSRIFSKHIGLSPLKYRKEETT